VKRGKPPLANAASGKNATLENVRPIRTRNQNANHDSIDFVAVVYDNEISDYGRPSVSEVKRERPSAIGAYAVGSLGGRLVEVARGG
jgi:hypothetical protein